jgi:geranylgeranyl diphosphate synthase, type II
MQSTSETELTAILSNNKKALDKIALDFLPSSHSESTIAKLYDMMRDYPLRGGKGIRGTLCILWCELFGGNREDALTTAAALELFQNWILIHDDIEDESDMRRGSPVLHKKYGVPLSINAGDALHGKMWQLLLKNRDNLSEEMTLDILSQFSEMLNETTEGQQIELAWNSEGNWTIEEKDYLLMVTKKSSWYTCIIPSRLGLILSRAKLGTKSNPDLLEKLVPTGRDLGISFQITDDILNLTASESKYGKEILGDLYEGKRTLMLIHLLRNSSPSERQEIVRTLSKPRSAKSDSEVKQIFQLMKQKGSIDYAKQIALQYYKRSLESFERIPVGDSSSSKAAKNTIKQLYEYLARRDY